jgi:vancomycin resistance protein YoaR
VRVGSVAAGGITATEAEARLVAAGAGRPPDATTVGGGGLKGATSGREARLTLRWEERVWPIPLDALGLGANTDAAVSEALSIGRKGTLWNRTFTFLASMVHGYYVPLFPTLKEQSVIGRLAVLAKEIDQPSVDARYAEATDSYTEASPGRQVDVPNTLVAIQEAVRTGHHDLSLVVKTVEPRVGKDDLVQAREYQVARFVTPILVADEGRVQNINLAVQKIRSAVVMPGETFSFNQVVGPRDAEHGWAEAQELYQGEFILGFGGGICQVSSSLYNAALLAGLEIVQRHHHDRPLTYVDPGRDATVVYNQLDLQFRNTGDLPVWIGARVLPGTTQQVEVSIFGSKPREANTIRLEAADVSFIPPELTEIPDPTLAPNERKVIDEGYFGIKVTLFRIFHEGDAERREQISIDSYQPRAGKVRVGVPLDGAPKP